MPGQAILRTPLNCVHPIAAFARCGRSTRGGAPRTRCGPSCATRLACGRHSERPPCSLADPRERPPARVFLESGEHRVGHSVVRRLRRARRDGPRELRRRGAAAASSRCRARTVALLAYDMACELKLVGMDDDLAWSAHRESVHGTRSNVRNPMHALNPGVTKDRAHEYRLGLRADDLHHRQVKHARSIAERAVPRWHVPSRGTCGLAAPRVSSAVGGFGLSARRAGRGFGAARAGPGV